MEESNREEKEPPDTARTAKPLLEGPKAWNLQLDSTIELWLIWPGFPTFSSNTFVP